MGNKSKGSMRWKKNIVLKIKVSFLFAKDESESVQEAFEWSENSGRREDYKILFVVGVSVKR
jgi:hypothetical protein